MREAEQRRRVLEAARNLFAEVGYHGFSVVAVADRSGLPRSTVYRLYADRRSLLSAMIAGDVEQLIGRLTLNIPAGGSLEDMLATSVGIWLDFVDERRSEYALLFGHTGRFDPDVASLLQSLRDQLADTYRRIFLPVLIAEGGQTWTELQSTLITHAAMALVEGVTLAWLSDSPLQRDRVVEMVTTMIRGVLGGGGGPVVAGRRADRPDPSDSFGDTGSSSVLLGQVVRPLHRLANVAPGL
jgi:AcrR family transcriptional regulator